MNSEILDLLNKAHDLLVDEYKELGNEAVKAFAAGNQALYDSLHAERDNLKTMFWAIDEFCQSVEPDSYFHNDDF